MMNNCDVYITYFFKEKFKLPFTALILPNEVIELFHFVLSINIYLTDFLFPEICALSVMRTVAICP